MRAILLWLALSLPVHADVSALLRPGAVALMRHATAPGTGDPPGFRVDDCSTQRNLSAAGLAEAARIGAALRAAGVAFSDVWTSKWCRCRDTAVLPDLGPVTARPFLNSFFGDRSSRDAQTRDTLAAVAALPPGARPIVVTHQVNITALTGIVPASGEIVVAEPDGAGGLRVTARLRL